MRNESARTAAFINFVKSLKCLFLLQLCSFIYSLVDSLPYQVIQEVLHLKTTSFLHQAVSDIDKNEVTIVF